MNCRIRGYKSSQIRYKTGHHTLDLETDGLIGLLKGRQSPRRIQDGLVAFCRKLACNRIRNVEGFLFPYFSYPMTSFVPVYMFRGNMLASGRKKPGDSGQMWLSYKVKALKGVQM